MFLFSRPIKRWRSQRKEKADERRDIAVRLAVLRGTVMLAFVVLSLQLWRLQIVEGSRYQQQAEENRVRVVSVSARRGVIYDREGGLLVANKPSFTAAVVLADVPPGAQRDLAARLEPVLGTPASELVALMEARRRSGQIFTPLALKPDLDRDTAFILEEHSAELPGVSVLMEPRRAYVQEGALAHILGYVGRISAEEYRELNEKGYDLNDKLGKMGVELTYEELLRGSPGKEQIEVDAAGRKRRVLASQEAVPGKNVVLSIDLGLQNEMVRVLTELMGRSQHAAAAAMDPRTGEVLAMVSLPSFDNNLFSSNLSPEALQELLGDPRRPMVNYAYSGAYPPGSTFKVVTGTAALQEGVARPDTVIESRGVITVPNQYNPSIVYPFYDWAALGRLDFFRAVAMSSDVYFYYLAGGYQNFPGLGPERLARYARTYGLGSPTGIDLPGEVGGVVPDPEWKQQAIEEEWLTGDTYNFGIGQGYLSVTPLQMLGVAAAVANGGDLLVPRVVKQVVDENGRVVRTFNKTLARRLPISAEHLQTMREGMRRAVLPGATADRAGVAGVELAGKTGTAEFGAPISGRIHETHGWYIGYGPIDNPAIAIVVFFQSGSGSSNAAPAAAKIMDYYFHRSTLAQRR